MDMGMAAANAMAGPDTTELEDAATNEGDGRGSSGRDAAMALDNSEGRDGPTQEDVAAIDEQTDSQAKSRGARGKRKGNTNKRTCDMRNAAARQSKAGNI